MNIKILTLIPVVAGLLYVNGMAEPKVNMTQTDNNLEPLYGIRFGKNNVRISVKSTGCTKPKHFMIKAHEKEGITQLEIIRNRPDRCRSMPKVILIEIELINENGKPYKLKNVFVSRLQDR